MLEFIEIKNDDDRCCEQVYSILKICGENMYKTQCLNHWLKPYPIDRIRDDIKLKRLFLVKINEEYIATFSLDKNSSKFFNDNEKYIYLSKFAVHPNQSGKGIGGKCLDYIEYIVQNEGYKGIRLDVYDKSIQAINFYIKNGFNKLFVTKTTNFNVICMEKRVENN